MLKCLRRLFTTQIRLYFRLCWFVFPFGLLVSCQTGDKVEPKDLPTPIPTPTFLRGIEPSPSSIIYMDDFEESNENICVQLYGRPLLEYNEVGLESRDFLERSTLKIDGTEWTHTDGVIVFDYLGLAVAYKTDPETGIPVQDPETGLSIRAGSNAVGPFVICWREVRLDEGLHMAEYQIRNASGDIFSYSWTFYISDS